MPKVTGSLHGSITNARFLELGMCVRETQFVQNSNSNLTNV